MRTRTFGLLGRLAIAGALMVSGACGGGSAPVSSRPAPKPVPANTPPASGALPNAGATAPQWTFRPSLMRQQFVVEQRAVLTVRDTATRTDTITARAQVSSMLMVPGTRITGSVASYEIEAGGVRTTPRGLVVPFPFGVDFAGRGRLTFTAPDTTAPCAPAMAVAQAMRDLWFQIPEMLSVGTTWSDSASYVVCRDGVPIRSTVRRTFKVVESSGTSQTPLFTLVRSARSSLAGEGRQSSELVTVQGTGAGELRYVIDAAAGAIRSATGTTTLELTLRSALRTQTVWQQAEVRITNGSGTP